MKASFTADTTYAYPIFVDFNTLLANKSSRLRLFVTLLCALCAAGSLYEFFYAGKTLEGILLLVAVAAIPFFVRYLKRRNLQKAWKNSPEIHGMQSHFSFYKDHFECTDKKGHSEVNYADLTAVYETPLAFYLMRSKTQGMVVSKQKGGEKLHAFLRTLLKK